MKGFRPTDDTTDTVHSATEVLTGVSLEVTVPEPLALEAAVAIPGVLGRISAARVQAYAGVAASAVPLLSSASRTDRAGFAEALCSPGIAIIAEVKRKSPSLGSIADLDPRAAAQAYAAGGAAALSVLTEPDHFGGDLSHLSQVAETVALPLIRKDFTVHPAQLFEARAHGASAVLLIVAVLRESTESYLQLARHLGLDALVEVHDEAELELALSTSAEIIGVNNRDLKTLRIDLGTAPRLLQRARDAGFAGLLVAESGYREASELTSLRDLADAVLVGSSVAGSGDLQAAVRRLYEGLEALAKPSTGTRA